MDGGGDRAANGGVTDVSIADTAACPTVVIVIAGVVVADNDTSCSTVDGRVWVAVIIIAVVVTDNYTAACPTVDGCVWVAIVVLFCSGLRRAPGCGTNGEYETASAIEPGSSLRLHNIYNNLKSTLNAILA